MGGQTTHPRRFTNFPGGGLRLLPKRRSQGLASNTLDYQSPYAAPSPTRQISANGIYEDGVYAKSGAVRAEFLLPSNENQQILTTFNAQIFSKDSSKPGGNSRKSMEFLVAKPIAKGTSEQKKTTRHPKSASFPILLLGLDAILDSLSNRSCWRP